MKTKLVSSITKNKKNNKTYLFIAFYYLLLLLFCLFFHYRNYLNADEGVILNGAWHLFNGYQLYFDFFEIIGPGSFYLVFWGFKIFGPHYYVASIISILVLWGGSIGIFKLLNLIKKDIFLNFIIPILFIIIFIGDPIINHNLYNIFFIIWSCYFLALGLKTNKSKYFVWGGFLGGLAVVFLQQKGLLFLGSTFLFLLMDMIRNKFKNYKNISIYVVFSLLPITLVLINWPIELLYYNLIKFPSLNYWEANKTSFLLLIIATLFFSYYAIRLKNKSKITDYLLFTQFFLLLSVIPLADLYHISLVVFPLLTLTPFLFIASKNWTKIIPIIFLFWMAIYSLGEAITNFKPFYFFPKDFIEFIREECPDKYIYVGPFCPGIYFETKKINASSYGLLIEGYSTTEQFEKALEEIKINQPSCIILNYSQNTSEHFQHQGNNVLEEYISKNYRIKKTYYDNQIVIYSNRE